MRGSICRWAPSCSPGALGQSFGIFGQVNAHRGRSRPSCAFNNSRGTMERKFLVTPFKLKSISTSGQFTGRAAVYGNIDSYGDVVTPGAFTQSLKDLGGE